MPKYAIRLDNEPIWFCNGVEELYDTEEQAIQAIEDEIKACEKAVASGYMDDVGSFEEYRIVQI